MVPVNLEGYECYLISEEGIVVNSRTGRVLKTDLNSTGYPRVTLSVGGKVKRMFVHTLVAETFLVKTSEDDVVNHKDGNKLNSNKGNLEWVSGSENAKHAFRTGLRVARGALPDHIVEGIRYLRRVGLSRKNIARQYDIKESRVSDVLYRYY